MFARSAVSSEHSAGEDSFLSSPKWLLTGFSSLPQLAGHFSFSPCELSTGSPSNLITRQLASCRASDSKQTERERKITRDRSCALSITCFQKRRIIILLYAVGYLDQPRCHEGEDRREVGILEGGRYWRPRWWLFTLKLDIGLDPVGSDSGPQPDDSF